MFIDMHMHEMTCSKDSFLKLDQIVSIAREKGLGAVCITDHDSMGLREYAAEYSRKVDFPIFVGIEFFSLQGDIVAFGIEDYPRERVSAQEFIDLVKAQNGVCFAAHPFRNNNRGLEDNLRRVRGLDGLEVLNGSTSFEPVEKRPSMPGSWGFLLWEPATAMCRRRWACTPPGFPGKSAPWKSSWRRSGQERWNLPILPMENITDYLKIHLPFPQLVIECLYKCGRRMGQAKERWNYHDHSQRNG